MNIIKLIVSSLTPLLPGTWSTWTEEQGTHPTSDFQPVKRRYCHQGFVLFNHWSTEVWTRRYNIIYIGGLCVWLWQCKFWRHQPASDPPSSLTLLPLTALQRRWEGPASSSYVRPPWGSAAFDFSVMSYNILSQELLQDNAYLYRHCDPGVLPWNHRLPNLLAEIKQHDADVSSSVFETAVVVTRSAVLCSKLCSNLKPLTTLW